MDADKLQNHIAQLEEKHQLLKQQITDGYSHYLDDVYLGKLKLEKLIVKRQLENIRKQLGL
jgi:hypothetical protein